MRDKADCVVIGACCGSNEGKVYRVRHLFFDLVLGVTLLDHG